jgi:hypothetical protein
MTTTGRLAVAVPVAVLAAGAGACTLLAGIDEGVLVDGADAGAKRDGTTGVPDARGDAATADASKIGDAGRPDAAHDATAPVDAKSPLDAPRDAGHLDRDASDAGRDAPQPAKDASDAAEPVALTCTKGTSSLVDNLSRYHDGGVPSYDQPLFVVPTTTPGTPLIFVQLASDTSGLTQYFPPPGGTGFWDFNHFNGQPSSGGFTLLDVRTLNAGTNGEWIQALASLETPQGINHGGSYGLEIMTFQGGEGLGGLGYQVADYSVAKGSLFHPKFDDGRLVPLPLNDAGRPLSDGGFTTAAFVTAPAVSFGTNLEVLAGDAGASQQLIESAGGSSFGVSDVFFASGKVLGTVLGGAGFQNATDGGYVAVETNDDLSADAAPPLYVVHPTSSAPPTGALIAGHTSAANPSKILLYAAQLTADKAHVEVYAGSVAPSALAADGGLTLGSSPSFTTGPDNVLPVNDPLFNASLTLNNGSTAWSGDEFVAIGPASNGTDLVLTWLSPTGRVVANATFPGAQAGGMSSVGQAAVSFASLLSESDATFFVAWVVHVPAEGGASTYDQLWSSQVTCAPSGG